MELIYYAYPAELTEVPCGLIFNFPSTSRKRCAIITLSSTGISLSRRILAVEYMPSLIGRVDR